MSKTLTIATISLLAIVMMTGTIAPAAFASGQGNGNDSEQGKAGHGEKGCETATEASEGKTKNPHCDVEIVLCEDIPFTSGMEFQAWFDEQDDSGDGFLQIDEWPGSQSDFDMLDIVGAGPNGTDPDGQLQSGEISGWLKSNC